MTDRYSWKLRHLHTELGQHNGDHGVTEFGACDLTADAHYYIHVGRRFRYWGQL